MRTLVSGSSGFIGSALMPHLRSAAAPRKISRLLRSRPAADSEDLYWNTADNAIEGDFNFDAVINLAGENIADGRWTAAKKQRIEDSRILGTRLLVQSIGRQESKPECLISASAIGYYGHRPDEVLTEDSPAGEGYLADLCRRWEAEALAAEEFGVRVVLLRVGVVLGRRGGALEKMLPPFQIGLGGRIGSGRQMVSWIALSDVLRCIEFLLDNRSVSGPINAVGPLPVSNLEFASTLARSLRRPALCPVPAFAAKMMFGSFAEEALLASADIRPAKLLSHNFKFECPTIESAIAAAVL